MVSSSNSGSSSSSSSTPCAACKMLRRRCGNSCVLAPYFPSEDISRFAMVHRIFGASNVVKLLQELPSDRRADAVSSMVYEARARIRDPVYGCAGTVFQMHSIILGLKKQLAAAQAQILDLRVQITNLSAFHSVSESPNHLSCTDYPPITYHSLIRDDHYTDLLCCQPEEEEEEGPIKLWEPFCAD